MYQSEVLRQRSDTRDELGFEMRWCWWRCWWRLTPSRWEDRWWWRWRWFPPPGGKFPRQNSSAGALDWFRLVAAEFLPESWLLIFFLRWKTSYSRRWAPEAFQGAHEAGGVPRGVGRAPTLVARVWPHLELFSLNIFYILWKNFREVLGLLELCRIGL